MNQKDLPKWLNQTGFTEDGFYCEFPSRNVGIFPLDTEATLFMVVFSYPTDMTYSITSAHEADTYLVDQLAGEIPTTTNKNHNRLRAWGFVMFPDFVQ